MARNIEIKARVADLTAARARALAAGARVHAVEVQTDRYYTVDGAHRVKLRTIAGGRAELVEYRRPEATGVRASDYTVTPVRDEAAGLLPGAAGRRRASWSASGARSCCATTSASISTRSTASARSSSSKPWSTSATTSATCRAQVGTLMRALGLERRRLIRASYAELLDQRSSAISTGVTKA